jgi:hypothetical protein
MNNRFVVLPSSEFEVGNTAIVIIRAGLVRYYKSTTKRVLKLRNMTDYVVFSGGLRRPKEIR